MPCCGCFWISSLSTARAEQSQRHAQILLPPMTSFRVALPFFWLIRGNKEFKFCASISWKDPSFCWHCIMLSQVKPVCHQVQAEKKIIYWITHKPSKEQWGTFFLDTNMISKYQCQAGELKLQQNSCAEKQKARKIWKLSSSCHTLVTCQCRKTTDVKGLETTNLAAA